MELELGLAPPNHGYPAAESCFGKRGSAEAFGAPKATLPLFVREDAGDDRGGGEHGCEWEISHRDFAKSAKRLKILA